MIDILIGLQWGDEGKGKIVDYLAPQYDLIVRFQGGPNAGHSIYYQDKKIVLHQVPSGILHSKITNIIGGCVVLDPIIFIEELTLLYQFDKQVQERIILAENTSLILPTHRLIDQMNEEKKGASKIGSTLRGIGPAYMDKTGRNALKLKQIFDSNFDQQYKELKNFHLQQLSFTSNLAASLEEYEKKFFEAIEKIKSFQIVNLPFYINDCLKSGKKILAEGAQGTLLDIDLGTYPYVTSSNTISAGICASLGVAPQKIGRVFGVTKGYCTRVGNGPFPTEIKDLKVQEFLRQVGKEFGATTGRPRRCGWLDLVALNYACMINGVTDIIITKMDILEHFSEINICDSYLFNDSLTNQFPSNTQTINKIVPQYKIFPGWNSPVSHFKSIAEFPINLKEYINFIQKSLSVNIFALSTGVNQQDIILNK